jgi:hypothetical protein
MCCYTASLSHRRARRRKAFFTCLSQKLASDSIMMRLVELLSTLEFEARKDVAVIFRTVLQQQQEQQHKEKQQQEQQHKEQQAQQQQQHADQPPQAQAQPPAQPAPDASPVDTLSHRSKFSVEFLCEEYDNDNEAPPAPGADDAAAPGLCAARTRGVRNTLYLLMCGYKYRWYGMLFPSSPLPLFPSSPLTLLPRVPAAPTNVHQASLPVCAFACARLIAVWLELRL